MSPQRKADKNGQEHAARGAGGRARPRLGYISETYCMKSELEARYRGEGGYMCGCPICHAVGWCALSDSAGRPCERFKCRTGAANEYPFCHGHFNIYIERWPPLAAGMLKALREWEAAGRKKSIEFSEIGKLSSTSEMGAFYLARQSAERQSGDVVDTELKFLDLVKRLFGAGAK